MKIAALAFLVGVFGCPATPPPTRDVERKVDQIGREVEELKREVEELLRKREEERRRREREISQ
jgi:hypothetical protein